MNASSIAVIVAGAPPDSRSVTMTRYARAPEPSVSAVTVMETMAMVGRTAFGGLDSVGSARLQPLVRAMTASTVTKSLDLKLSL
jgi:hypothetical protein